MINQSEQERDAHRAIGRYIVEFSILLAEMRGLIERQLQRDDPMLPRLALGELQAANINNAFFAICEQIADLDDEEQRVSARLKQEVVETIKDRNDLAHGDWEMGFGILGEPQLLRTKPGRRAGAWIAKIMPAEELDARSDQVARVAERVMEFGWLCVGTHPLTLYSHLEVRVRDIFRYQKHRGARRKGRYADEPWWPEET